MALFLENDLKKAMNADVVQVVRCKDCRYFVQEDEINGYCDPSIWEQSAMRTIYDFCSKGERKDAID